MVCERRGRSFFVPWPSPHAEVQIVHGSPSYPGGFLCLSRRQAVVIIAFFAFPHDSLTQPIIAIQMI